MPLRFARYVATAGFNTNINGRQFGVSDFKWPTAFRQPDLTYDEELTVTIGGVAFELHHGMGETDDHTWTWIADRKVIVSGDFVIWAAPNCGNPQKVQRYCKPWADAFRAMAAKGATALVPGHGPAVFGADRVTTLLGDAAKLLDTIHDQTLALMNEGKTLDQVVAGVKMPLDLLSKPYLQPTYDDPEFLVRNIWRLYGGWWDGDPAHLKPALARRSPASWRRLQVAPKSSPSGRASSPSAANCAWPGTSPSSRQRRSRTMSTFTRPASRSTRCARRRNRR